MHRKPQTITHPHTKLSETEKLLFFSLKQQSEKKLSKAAYNGRSPLGTS